MTIHFNGWKRRLSIAGAGAGLLVALLVIHDHAVTWWYEEKVLRLHLAVTDGPGGLIDQFQAMKQGQADMLEELRGIRKDLRESRTKLDRMEGREEERMRPIPRWEER